MDESDLYAFAFRGLLCEEGLRASGGTRLNVSSTYFAEDVAKRLPFERFDEDALEPAQRMAAVYCAIAAFENGAREFVVSQLLEQVGGDWWEQCVPEKRRHKAECRRDEENRVRWHSPRGDKLINYTDLEDLSATIVTNWPLFENILGSAEWVKEIFKTIERSRNVIMHSGELLHEDIERLGMCMRDWINQVGD